MTPTDPAPSRDQLCTGQNGRVLPRLNASVLIGAVLAVAFVSVAFVSGTAATMAQSTGPVTVATVAVSTAAAVTTATIGSSAVIAVPSVSPTDYVDQALGVIERNSYFADKVDMVAERRRAMDRAAAVDSVADTYPIIEDVLKATGDKHALFRPPAIQVQITQGKSQGFGFVAVWPSRIVVILTVGGPADKGGLKLGDRIDRVNDGPIPHTSNEINFKKDASGNLPLEVALTVRRGPKAVRVALKLGDVTTINTPSAQAAPTPRGSRLAGQVGYLDVPGIVGDASAQRTFAQQTQSLLSDLDPAARCGWIVDLRRNKGGYIAAMLAGVAPLVGSSELSSRVLADGSKVSFTFQNGELRQGSSLELGVTPPLRLPRPGRPVAVLTSTLTASAAEATALVFLGRPNSRVFGEATYGLTSYTILSVLHDGASLTVTNALDVDAAGRTHDGPIVPDETVPVDWSQVATGNDPVLRAALRWLDRQPACTR